MAVTYVCFSSHQRQWSILDTFQSLEKITLFTRLQTSANYGTSLKEKNKITDNEYRSNFRESSSSDISQDQRKRFAKLTNYSKQYVSNKLRKNNKNAANYKSTQLISMHKKWLQFTVHREARNLMNVDAFRQNVKKEINSCRMTS